jgi:glycosyltransferase involved in cell wall biosynthesis
LSFLFNFNIKFILRISGYPKLNFFRELFWKFFLKKFLLITCPTKLTYELLIRKKIIDNNKIITLNDPIICLEEISLRNNKIAKKNNFILSIGRLTKQKNFSFLIKAFKNPIFFKKKLFIIGEGEDRKKLSDYILELAATQNVDLLGFKKDVFSYLGNAECFVLSSLWEDPGFVLIEAAYSRTPIISSDCPHGPTEFLDNGNNGYLYKTNSLDDFIFTYKKFQNDDYKNVRLKLLKALKAVKNYTLFRHYKNLSQLLI